MYSKAIKEFRRMNPNPSIFAPDEKKQSLLRRFAIMKNKAPPREYEGFMAMETECLFENLKFK